jgi:hypothetical protein
MDRESNFYKHQMEIIDCEGLDPLSIYCFGEELYDTFFDHREHMFPSIVRQEIFIEKMKNATFDIWIEKSDDGILHLEYRSGMIGRGIKLKLLGPLNLDEYTCLEKRNGKYVARCD